MRGSSPSWGRLRSHQPGAGAATVLSRRVRSSQVDIRFPQSGAPDPNCVTVTGLPENVEEAIDHILNLEEEYVSAEVARGGPRGLSGVPGAASPRCRKWVRTGVLVKHPHCGLTPPPPPRPQLADVADSEVLQVHVKPPVHEEARAPSKGFVVRDAPWTASSSEKVGGFLQGTPPHAQRPGEGAARGRPSAAPC